MEKAIDYNKQSETTDIRNWNHLVKRTDIRGGTKNPPSCCGLSYPFHYKVNDL
jgi:hypothetical protein